VYVTPLRALSAQVERVLGRTLRDTARRGALGVLDQARVSQPSDPALRQNRDGTVAVGTDPSGADDVTYPIAGRVLGEAQAG
jgi:hypothetical protein